MSSATSGPQGSAPGSRDAECAFGPGPSAELHWAACKALLHRSPEQRCASGDMLSLELFRKERQLLLQPSPNHSSPASSGRQALRLLCSAAPRASHRHVLSHRRRTHPVQGPCFSLLPAAQEAHVAKQIIFKRVLAQHHKKSHIKGSRNAPDSASEAHLPDFITKHPSCSLVSWLPSYSSCKNFSSQVCTA